MRFWAAGGAENEGSTRYGWWPFTGVLGVGFFDPNFSGKDFWCAEYVDYTANNAIMLSFAILDIFLHRVNASGFRGDGVENTVLGHLWGFRSDFFWTQIFSEKTFGVRNT